jgi:hypothetical protein
MATTSQKNSFVTIAEQISLLNLNATEIITRLNDVVTAQDSSINITQLDDDGNETTYAVPTVGRLQSEINEANENIKRLAGMNDNNVHIIDGKSTKKIYLADLNREPNRIDNLDVVNTFKSTNNWFFESLMNPILSVVFDVTDKVGADVDGVISKRYIIDFEKDDNNNYTNRGEQSRLEFIDKFLNKTNINMVDFLDWVTNPTNKGVVNNLTPTYDEQFFEFDYQEVEEQGTFSVLKQEVDDINNKLWFHIYPFRYTTLGGDEKVIKNGDELVLNKQDSVTRWKVLETSVSSSNFRVRLERLEGFDPIPTGTNILKFYGNIVVDKKVRVSVGFDEYLMVFMKSTNSKNRIKSSVWSRGIGIYTNDLVLDTDQNVTMAQYYLDMVFDYGNLLKDMIEKQIPSSFGITPNSPELKSEDFKVVQINKHITDTDDAQEMKNLHKSKNTLKSKLEQVNDAISQKNQELSVKKYNSVADKNRSQNELNKLVSEQESLSKNLYSITRQIKSKTDIVNKANPKFRIRGFWDIPEGKQQSGYRTQEIVQFKIQYRYSSKTGSENQTEGYELIDGDKTKTGYFSNWVQLYSDLRKRAYDEETETWTWEIEDVSDAGTPNINQLDISIIPGEKVEVRVKSISEVGYPDSLLESDWSNVLIVEFPDDLNNVLDQNSFILQEAEQDNILVEFEQSLDSKGVNRHVRDSFFLSEEYIAHTDETIQTSYKDDQGNPFTLKEYLEYLTNKMTELENIIYSSKGVLKVTIFNGSDDIEIKNNTVTNINLTLQNYGLSTDGVTYQNKVSIIKDFYMKFENLSTSSTLNFLVRDSYSSGTTIRFTTPSTENLAALVDNQNDFVIQENNQFIYFCDNYQGAELYNGNITHNSSTQISAGGLQEDTTKMIGLSSSYINKNRSGNPSNSSYPATGQGTEWFNGNGTMGTTIAPQVKVIDDLFGFGNSRGVDKGDSIVIPINIYWVFKTSLITSTVNINDLSLQEHNKSLRMRLHPSSLDAPFEFVINFNIQNKNI